ncbi:LysR substrate-binding domain-containing protein [Micromonospora sp. CPCC 206060]|uniref:LysR substrate-binding domain-containing protein n=1 Tax=Micromonospora sp. CPCC 206060 TaxID=3122406 RepID=UPI002FF3FC4A
MELRQLRYFATVAETCHFGRAAERLHIAQPALSQAVRQLESELRTALFTRTTRQVALTAAGAFLYEEARRILDTLDATVQGVRRVAEGRRGLVRLGLTGSATFSHLPRIARIVKHELPGVAMEIHSDLLTPEQCERLREGSLDLGVLRPPVTGEGIGLCTIDVEPLVLAVPVEHRLADQPEVALADLHNEAFVAYGTRDSVVNQAVLRSCHEAGFAPRREHEAVGTSVLLGLVAAGLGVALVPAGARSLPLHGVVFRGVTNAPTVELALGWSQDAEAPVAASLRELILGVLRQDTTVAPTVARNGALG